MSENGFHVVIGNLENVSHRDIWFICYRPQINLLMAGGEENHLAALVLMWVCMERAFTLHKPEFDPRVNGGKIVSVTDKVLRWFLVDPDTDFPEDYKNRIEQVIKILKDDLVNGLKHDSFMREGVKLEDMIMSMDEHQEHPHDIVTPAFKLLYKLAIDYRNGEVLLAPTNFWYLVRYKIDSFYISEYGEKVTTSQQGREDDGDDNNI